jgi:phenylpropionate dioxygenase-like ring-hydroxylating dioxygenase large terminal subunit
VSGAPVEEDKEMSVGKVRDIKRGHGSAERPLAAELWANDTYPNFAAREQGNYDPTYDKVNYRRYYDADYARQELEKIWMKSWILACREEDIPEVGNRLPVNVGPVSFFVVRTGPDTFKAFYNSCLHRGTQLCSARDSGDVIRCPYHAWEWKIDGSLNHIPSHWDFKMVTAKNGALREVHLGRWGGFIYINADPNALSFEATLGVLPKHLEQFDMANRYTAAHFRRLVHANWKLTQEAFMESYHVVGTHPNAIPFSGDTQSQYDIYDDGIAHIGRQLTPGGHPSMHASPDVTPAYAIIGAAQFLRDMHFPNAELPRLDSGKPVRPQVAEWMRKLESERLGRPCVLSDAIMLDSTLYFRFPHSTFWLSEALPFAYRFMPHEKDPEKSYMEVRILKHYPTGQERPPPAQMVDIGPDDRVSDHAPGFGFLGDVFDQDFTNLPRVQAGVRSADPTRDYATLGDYQEFIIKRWLEVMDEMMAG